MKNEDGFLFISILCPRVSNIGRIFGFLDAFQERDFRMNDSSNQFVK